jgi:hypothetical protein
MTAAFTIDPARRRAFDRLAADLQRVFGGDFVALVASGPTASVAFARRIDARDLEALGPLSESWHREGLQSPLLLTPEEFRRSLDAFPVEYQTILDRHVAIAGQPPFDNASVDDRHLRQACEVQAKSHLLHLRQGWMEAGAHHDALESLLARSAAPLRAVLANLARLSADEHSPRLTTHDPRPRTHDPNDLAASGAALAGLPARLIADVLALEQNPDRAEALVSQMPAYLAACEQLWAYIDTWRSQ